MKKLLADILFWIGDKACNYDNALAAWLYVNCMRWSDKLVPWPEIDRCDLIDDDEDTF